MPITVTSIPTVNVNGNANTVSKYFCLNRPILFKVQRNAVDYTFSNIDGQSTTVAQVTAPGIGDAFASSFQTGEIIYVEISGSDFPDGTYKVVGSFSAGANVFFIDITGMGYGVGSHFLGGNLLFVRKNYRVKTKIKVNSVVIATITNRIDSTDTATIDVAPFLKSLLTYKDDYNYTTTNAIDEGRGQPFTLEFAESWAGFVWDFFQYPGYYFVNAVFQLHEKYNGNMADFVPFSNYDINDIRAKFLCDFAKPTFFVGYPFSLDFIFNDDLDVINFDYKKKEQKKDVNLINSGIVESISLIESGKKYVNRMKLTGSYAETIKFVDVWLEKEISI